MNDVVYQDEFAITSFKDLMSFLTYDWIESGIVQVNETDFVLNKTYITPKGLFYKTEAYPISLEVYEKLKTLYLLQEN